MVRLYDWPERLAAFIETRRSSPFKWGENDCALFAADAVLAMTGEDLAADWRGYKTERGAASRIAKAGGMRGFAATLTAKHAGFAQRGDVVLVMIAGRETFGMVCGNGHWCAPGPDCLTFRPMSEVGIVFGV